MEILRLDADPIPDNFTGIVIWEDGKVWYFRNRKFHREDGPAIEHPNGRKSYYLNNVRYGSQQEWFQALTSEQKENFLYSESFGEK